MSRVGLIHTAEMHKYQIILCSEYEPTFNGSSAHGNSVEIHNGIMFSFYPGLPHTCNIGKISPVSCPDNNRFIHVHVCCLSNVLVYYLWVAEERQKVHCLNTLFSKVGEGEGGGDEGGGVQVESLEASCWLFGFHLKNCTPCIFSKYHTALSFRGSVISQISRILRIFNCLQKYFT